MLVGACGGPQVPSGTLAGDSGESPSTSGTTGDSTTGAPGAESNTISGTQLFLLIGQSNMEGAPRPEPEDRVENPSVKVLGFDNFGDRKWNQWDTAAPPLHRVWAGVGPGDSFGKAMAEAWPAAIIGLVPCAISGVDIDFFRKGVTSQRRSEYQIPPDNKRTGAYEMVIERAQLAQRDGVIRGILFHQGESDNNNEAWPGKVKELVADLRTDLGLGESVPFVAGELLYGGCCSAHNVLVRSLPSHIPNAHVVSAAGLAELNDPWNAHFDLPGQRELGRRYAATLLEALKGQSPARP